ncbi:M67 family metallopeptidase [Ornithinibacillus sp. JPR2-1]|uniref:M67 family metallopeptidase n=1 Tax=Ornithinibacillus sp. JPR2-1 TaxID=2094019 RepID=UPI0031DF98A4
MESNESVIIIPKEVLKLIIQNCYQALPYECCGFLSGRQDNEVISNWNLKNEAKLKKQFKVSSHTVGEVLRRISAKGEKVIILYHSHPTAPPIPSMEDLQYHPDEDIKMLIISLMNKEIQYKCYQVSGMEYKEVPVQIMES